MKKAASNAWNTVKRVATNTWNTVKSAVSHAVNWVGNKVSQAVNWVGTQVNHVKNWAVQQWNNYQSAPSYQASSGSYGGGYHSPSSSHAYAQQQQAQARAQAEQRRQQHIRDEYSQSTGIKTTPKTREAKSLFRNWGKALKEMYTHVCKTAKRVKKQVANYVKKIDWKKVAVTAGAIGVGIALTVATGGLGAPVAMAIGGAASGGIISGYDAYSSGQRGWALAGSALKGAGLGAITGFVGGQFIGAGANVAANVTQNIANQSVRHVAKAGVEAGVETVIDTGISLATGNPISLKNVATDYGLNLITNGSGSVSSKKSAKADVHTSKPNKSRIPVEFTDANGNKSYGEVLDADYIHTRPVKDVTSTTSISQKRISGPDPNAPRLESPPTIDMRKLTPEETYLYRRPTHYRKNMKSDTWDNAKFNGVVTDPVTGAKINPNEPWQMGHKPGYEFRKHQVSAADRGISRKQFLDEYNNPQHFRPEHPPSNMGHGGEDLTNTYFGP